MAGSPCWWHRDSVASMTSRIALRHSLVYVLVASLVVPTPIALAQQSMAPGTVQAPASLAAANEAAAKKQIASAQANQATIRITRKAADEYAVANVGNGTIVIKTKYCHEYVRDEEAILQTSEDGGENALLFATGAYCEVVGVNKENDRSYGVIDFLIDLGLMLLNKATGGVTPKPMPKRN